MEKLKRPAHLDKNRAGRFIETPSCDGCGKPVGTAYFTDDEVCGVGDGPGFYVCERKCCSKKLNGLDIEARRAVYTATRLSWNARGSRTMTKKKTVEHSPGPWRFNGMSLRIVDLIGATICVAPVPFNMMTDEELEQWRAAARLVAAAPDLLKELDWTARLLEMAAFDFDEAGLPQKASSMRTYADKARRLVAMAMGSNDS